MEYKINIETLTPVHTGSGNELSMNFDLMHFPHEECLAVVNAEKVFELLREENIDEWVKQIERKVSMMDFLKKENPRLKPNDIGSRILNIVGKAPSSQTTVKEQYMSHAEKKPTLSGSSIKGAMRTAFLTQIGRAHV